jgi:hypothetical protein
MARRLIASVARRVPQANGETDLGRRRYVMSHRGKNRFILALAAATLVASLSAGVVAAGEITGNGKLKDVNGHSACAFSGQEDLQWYLDDGNTMPRPEATIVKGFPSHAQSWGQIPKADREFLTSIGHNPGIACNPTLATGE